MDELINDTDIVNTNSLAIFFTEGEHKLYNRFKDGELVIYIEDKENGKAFDMCYFGDRIFQRYKSNDYEEYEDGTFINDKLFGLSCFLLKKKIMYLNLTKIINEIKKRFKEENKCYESVLNSYYCYEDGFIFSIPRSEFEQFEYSGRKLGKYIDLYRTNIKNELALILDIWDTHVLNNGNDWKEFDWNEFITKLFTKLDKNEKKSIDNFHKKVKKSKVYAESTDSKYKIKRKVSLPLIFT